MSELFSPAREKEVLRACRVLFGSQAVLNHDFLAYVQLDGVRDAYLSRAKLTHPDRFPGAGLVFLQQQAERFRRVAAAYDIMNDFLSDRERGLWLPGKRETLKPYYSATQRNYSNTRPQREREAKVFRSFSGARSKTSTFSGYSGISLPQRPLPFGLYLNYHGLVSHTELAQALVWQRRQRPRLGDLSQRWGRLNEFEVKDILRARRQGARRFGEKAIALGLLSQFQVDTMIYFQRSKQRPIGKFFVEQGLIPSSSIERLVSDLHDHNERVLLDTPLLRRFLGIFF